LSHTYWLRCPRDIWTGGAEIEFGDGEGDAEEFGGNEGTPGGPGTADGAQAKTKGNKSVTGVTRMIVTAIH
jgi:hypothetical protein